MIYPKISNAELAAFLRQAAIYFRNRDTRGEDSAFWANEANAERCEIAASRLDICDHVPMKAALDNEVGCIRCGEWLGKQQ